MAEYNVRLCGTEWRYCNSVCAECSLAKVEYSATTTHTPKERGVGNG